ncbi:MAG TPA: M28 family peptidase [Longimicrobiales bacterium]|nr:M28 family peptidase [Longimicrobiales bacterium]
MTFSPRGDVTAPVSGVDLSIGSDDSTSGCETADFAGFTAGHIALLQRGGCTFPVKAENADDAGAAAVIIFNSLGVAGPTRGTLTADYAGSLPVLGATYSLGAEWSATPGLEMHVVAATEFQNLQVETVIAESRSGDPGNVVVIGGHLDSAPGSPGINDNGSGAAAILETALQLADARTRNRLRFAFWTAHEIDLAGSGLLGSETYVSSLSLDELDAIALYLDFHMLDSPNGGRFVLDGDGSGDLGGGPGAAAIETFFRDFFADRDLAVESVQLNGRSDYNAFHAAGIPVGGITAGADAIKTPLQEARFGGSAGIAFDPCYHLPCDTFANVDLAALDLNSDAVAAAILTFAMNTEAVNTRKGMGRFKAAKTPVKSASQAVM